ncbi:bifunctional metallophosphatase/5'-nucleotidase [Enterococcus sp. JM4C]|uniref:bifunctional metallophosphatase/5'-nucleotidase n=1 Tax=Candidatus Enterococcus huntleyi TaxID=1857217 RepID=UPI00137B1693|nr:bifunctional metallophosphatase/5'-nucleotidase [Enterococcus sp. JM4C]KAF1296435.1 bifunctional metallophosphatase/5'-nucleotidase [Enterococcus sp. JM4C]
MEVKILATSDMHGYVEPTNYAEKNSDLPFGTEKVATLIKEIRQQAEGPVVLIENGDFIQGSPLSYYLAKNQRVGELTQVINALQYDVGVLGNHEFNYGLDYLKAAIASYNHPVLAANILDKTGQPAFGKAYELIKKDGLTIAILGLVTQYIPHWEQPATVKELTFKSIVETAKEYVPKLRAQADLVVVAYHGGFEKDLVTGEPTELLTGENEGYQLLQEVSGIDALVTGHQHREIATHINGVPVIQPGYRGSHIGEIILQVAQTAEGFKVSETQAAIHSVEGVAVAAEIRELIAPIAEEVEVWLDQPVGKVQGSMEITNPMAARIHEHPYIEFINRVQMAASGAKISGTSLFNNEGKGFGAQITMRDVITNYIYPNTLAVLKVSGADLRAALEQTANYLTLVDGEVVFNPDFIEPKPQYYNYDMYEGIDYVIDLTKPAFERITKLEFEGRAVESTDELEIVINQYRAVGGGNYAMFEAGKIIREIQIDMTELIANYLKEHPVIQAEANQNFTVLV